MFVAPFSTIKVRFRRTLAKLVLTLVFVILSTAHVFAVTYEFNNGTILVDGIPYSLADFTYTYDGASYTSGSGLNWYVSGVNVITGEALSGIETLVAGSSDGGPGSYNIVNNTLTIRHNVTADTLAGAVSVGYGTGRLENNTVYIDNLSTIVGNVIGGAVRGELRRLNSRNNSIYVYDATAITGDVIGGSSDSGSAIGNLVHIESGTITSATGVIGGSGTISASDNTVRLDNGTIDGNMYGGYTDNGTATYNGVQIIHGNDSAHITGDIYGSWSGNGKVSNSWVTMFGNVNIIGNIYGGYSDNMTSTGNSVSLTGNSIVGAPNVVGSIYGNTGNIYGGYSRLGDVSGNNVFISAVDNITGNVYGGYSDSGTSSNNSVSIRSSSGNFFEDVYGGYSRDGIARENIVFIDGNININLTIGLEAQIAGGRGVSAIANKLVIMNNAGNIRNVAGGLGVTEADGNTLELLGNSAYRIGWWAYGGKTESEDSPSHASYNTVIVSNPNVIVQRLAGGSTQDWGIDTTANNNTIIINGGTFIGGVIVGSALTTNGNTLTINGGTFDTAIIVGGTSTTLNNTFNLTTEIRAKSVRGFSTFNLTVNTVNAVIRAEEYVTFEDNSILKLKVSRGAPLFERGDTFTIIETSDGIIINGPVDGTRMLATSGMTLCYDVVLGYNTAKILYATVMSDGLVANPQLKSLSEGFLAGMTALQFGANVATENALQNMAITTKKGSGIFVGTGGNATRYKTGSYIDTIGFSIAAGIAKKVFFDYGEMVAGEFLEYGQAGYDSYNSFNTTSAINGEGKTQYIGLGTMGHFQSVSDNFIEASIRGGMYKTHYESNDFEEYVDFDASAPYFAIHFGVGHIQFIGARTTFTPFVKQFLTMQLGDTVKVAGDEIKFENMLSTITRAGVQMSHGFSDVFWTSIKLAYEYEHNGKARATLFYRDGATMFDRDIEAPSLTGSTFAAGLGFDITPRRFPISTSFDVDLATGQREGVSGSLQFTWNFKAKDVKVKKQR
ncbi:hypothetical protein RsTz2092_05250 [Deferribacterales bacterium RsTz2092]|nr:hypothetical protein AGMMS49941_00920 [Deferribacterales bacterium]